VASSPSTTKLPGYLGEWRVYKAQPEPELDAVEDHLKSLLGEDRRCFYISIIETDGGSALKVGRVGYISDAHRIFHLSDPKCFHKLMIYCNQCMYFSHEVISE
jgi:hypothetical protein